MPLEWALQVDLREPTAAASALDALGAAWVLLLASPPQTVVAVTNQAGDTWALKTSDQLEVIVIPF